MTSSFKLAPALYGSIHELRQTREGIQYLKATGQFKEYMARRNEYPGGKLPGERDFLAWDGEGWTDNDGEHRYMLLMNSTGSYIEWPRLSSTGCLDLILTVGAQNPGVIHVIYGGGYDVTHILRDMPSRLRDMLLTGTTVTWTVAKTWYRLEYLPHKWFVVTGIIGGQRVKVKIYDVMTFFQSSFVHALESRGIDVPDEIRTGKAARSNFTFADLDGIIEYCRMELDSLVRLANQLRSEFNEAGINVRAWHGPGAVASAVLTHYGIRKHKQTPSDVIEVAAQHAYFGGRFEAMKVGHHDSRVYQADINSAYPYAISTLPSLDGARWEYTEDYDGSPGIWFCTFMGTGNHILPYPLPWRSTTGSIVFAMENDGTWCWHPEAKFASEVHHGYRLVPATDHLPFGFVQGMYTKRREWKALGKGGERALKLALNSLYGKMAQRIGGYEKYGGRPPWHQLEWAGIITSTCRAMIWEAIRQAPDSVIAIETDSVVTTQKLDLLYGTGLGEWSLDEYDWITYLQSGVYFTSGDEHAKVKTRGLDVRELTHEHVMSYLASDRTVPMLVKDRQFIAMGNPRRGLYGQWQDSVKEIGIANGKRVHLPPQCPECASGVTMAERMHTLHAHPFMAVGPSAPHKLPWRDGLIDDEPEMVDVGTVAVEAWQ